MYYVLYVCMCTLYTYIYIIIHIIIYKCMYIYIYWSTASIRRDMTTPLSFMFGNRIIDNNHMHRMVLLQLYKHYLVKIRYRVVSTVAWSTRLVLTLRFGSGPWLNRACCACRIKKPLRSQVNKGLVRFATWPICQRVPIWKGCAQSCIKHGSGKPAAILIKSITFCFGDLCRGLSSARLITKGYGCHLINSRCTTFLCSLGLL